MYAPADHRGPVRSRDLGRNLGRGPGTGVRARRLTMAANVSPQPQREAATELPCSVAPDLFFAEKPAEIRQARALCTQCPARGPCLEGALQRAEPWGVWGGELILRGAIIASKRARGRPRSASARPESPAEPLALG